MMIEVIPTLPMVRRTITLPESTDALIRASALERESFSAAATRLIEAGARSVAARPPRFVASGEGPEDLGVNAERYLRELIDLD
jgi:hypothetical protein